MEQWEQDAEREATNELEQLARAGDIAGLEKKAASWARWAKFQKDVGNSIQAQRYGARMAAKAKRYLAVARRRGGAKSSGGVKVVDRMDNRDVMVKKGKTDYVVTHEGFAFKELPKGQAKPLVKATRQAQGPRPFPKKKVRF